MKLIFCHFLSFFFNLIGYHWDTSDWAPGPSMPNISEIPTSEILHSPSSSQPSDDCNANADNFDNITNRGIYNGGDGSPLLGSAEQRQNNINNGNINDDDEDGEQNISIFMNDRDQDYLEDSEYVGDSEYAENEPYEHGDIPPSYADHPKYEQLLQDLDDSYRLPGNFSIHPSQYLPRQDFDLDSLTEDENMDNKPHGAIYVSDVSSQENEYPALRPPKEFMTPGYGTDDYLRGQGPPSRISFIDDMSMSLGGLASNASCSDISGLCEIEDSEVNATDTDDENTPCLSPGQLQTRV